MHNFNNKDDDWPKLPPIPMMFKLWIAFVGLVVVSFVTGCFLIAWHFLAKVW